MGKPKIVHAPIPSTVASFIYDNEPMCSTRAMEPRIAKPGQTITCKACARAVYDRAQYYALLRKAGFRFVDEGTREGMWERGRAAVKRGRRVDPCQLNIGDAFDEEP